MSLCRHFTICGGCSLQHQSYQEQLIQKEEAVRALFSMMNVPTLPIIPSPSPWAYRNKMEFSFSQTKEGSRFVGLMQRGKRRVEDLTECHLVSTWMMEALLATRKWWKGTSLNAYFGPKDVGTLRTLTLREGKRTGDKMAFLTVSGHPDFQMDGDSIQSFKTALLEAVPSLSSILIRVQHLAKKKPTWFSETLLYGKNTLSEVLYKKSGDPLFFKIRASSFFQPNTEQAEKLYQAAVEMADIQDEDVVYDLYCGTGSLGMYVASCSKSVFGIEINEDAVADAATNCALNNITNMQVVSGDVAAKLAGDPTVVFVDPPRPGLSPEAIQKLNQMNPRKIIYVSCNPTTQLANVLQLQALGYKVDCIQPFDQFPQTPHIENIVALSRLV